MEKELYALVGWLFALISLLLVEAYKTRRSYSAVRRALKTELGELQYRLVAIAWTVALRTGAVDRPFLEWLVPVHERYRGVNRDDQLVESARQMLQHAADMPAAVEAFRAKQPGHALGLRPLHAPALSIALTLLGEFPGQQQAILLEVQTFLQNYNSLVEDARQFLFVSFEQTLTVTQQIAIRSNLNTTYGQVLSVCREISALIERFFGTGA